MAKRKTKNYLNNKSILKEIHKSKNSYCTYMSPAYADYDIILDSLEDIHKVVPVLNRDKEVVRHASNLELARENRLKRLSEQCPETSITLTDISDDCLIFRIYDWSHIPKLPPEELKKPKRKKAETTELLFMEEIVPDMPVTDVSDKNDTSVANVELVDLTTNSTVLATTLQERRTYEKVNFPPFSHWKYNDEGELVKVGVSHWKGYFDKNGDLHGEFCATHGYLTNELAKMIMLLVTRNATKFNWRSYTYNDEFKGQAITQLVEVALQFNEARSNNPFSYYTSVINNSFTKILLQEKTHQDIRDDILEMNDLEPSYTRQLNNDLARQEMREKLQREIDSNKS